MHGWHIEGSLGTLARYFCLCDDIFNFHPFPHPFTYIFHIYFYLVLLVRVFILLCRFACLLGNVKCHARTPAAAASDVDE
jgi:hypothetical protein